MLTKEELEKTFGGRSHRFQTKVLIEFIYELTLAERDAWLAKQEGRFDAEWLAGQLTGFMETIHLASGHALKLIEADPKAHSDTIIQALLDRSVAYAGPDGKRAAERAFQRVLSRIGLDDPPAS